MTEPLGPLDAGATVAETAVQADTTPSRTLVLDCTWGTVYGPSLAHTRTWYSPGTAGTLHDQLGPIHAASRVQLPEAPPRTK